MRYYKPGKVSKTAMASLARQAFGSEPFTGSWQIATATTVLEGRDAILDVGTGSGKTLAYVTPIVEVSICVSNIVFY